MLCRHLSLYCGPEPLSSKHGLICLRYSRWWKTIILFVDAILNASSIDVMRLQIHFRLTYFIVVIFFIRLVIK